jgi:adenosylhomocysteine nucleosidase
MAGAAEELIAAINDDDADRVTALLADDPELVNTRDRNGVSALMLSRYRFDRATTDALLALDPELDVFEAATLGIIDRVNERLVEDPSRATAFSPDGFTALHLAAFFGKTVIARRLIEAGADPGTYSANEFDVQPLHSAAAGRHVEICRLLIAAGADVNAPQRNGFRALHAAAQHGDVELLELLLSAGADPVLATDDGETPARTAEAEGHVDVARRLREVATAQAG